MQIHAHPLKSLILACSLALAAPSVGVSAQENDENDLPRGTYKSECENIRVEGRYVYASCPDRQGNMKESKVRHKDCMNIKNSNGRLRCQKMAM